jgi:omega-hydroxy-beta-dihydromenaquinone-9 sulfotransferase
MATEKKNVFTIPPISTLLGSTIGNFWRAIRYGRVDPAYYHKVFLTSLVCLFARPFHLWERLKDRNLRPDDESPLFILGHWRSGTTFLHNLLCQDPNTSYVTTYQSVFPNNMYSKLLFKPFMRWNIPDKRPSDDVKLHVDFPQEDGFAMANILPAFYHFFYFPDAYKALFDENVVFKHRSKKDIEKWQAAYRKLIAKAKANTSGQNIMLKNPANTARIDKILELYPKARFIHIYRNPVAVYLSSKKFFQLMIPTLQLQKTTPEQIEDMVFDLYARLMHAYFEQKSLIPSGRLVEISFELFEKAPLNYAEKIYQQLGIEGWQQALPYFEQYLEDLGGYKKSVYRISQKELDRIMTEWSFAFSELGYQVPEGIEIVN